MLFPTQRCYPKRQTQASQHLVNVLTATAFLCICFVLFLNGLLICKARRSTALLLRHGNGTWSVTCPCWDLHKHIVFHLTIWQPDSHLCAAYWKLLSKAPEKILVTKSTGYELLWSIGNSRIHSDMGLGRWHAKCLCLSPWAGTHIGMSQIYHIDSKTAAAECILPYLGDSCLLRDSLISYWLIDFILPIRFLCFFFFFNKLLC